ncbi:MAG: peptidoglycan editing factor PgeF [Candidatus Marinimicrobia bacterium]|nr:peptidoglycan editing factor PgeF [Candidatus Neomarinimicrobiota bacterium]MBL7023469.1 peptidoglycan editing factor PgeF [Candidatus Neomarinimicrobiota bacterium]MBL7109276.1 peptidoglycan editing factor PgeF [Candidatus Neomarinimicrobiota bacterium]
MLKLNHTFFNISHLFDDQITALLSRRISLDNPKIITDNREQLARKAGFNPQYLAIPHQVHSDIVQWIDKAGNYPNTDSLITDNHEVVLTLQVADCVPVYLFDKITKTRALVHAGWRGVVSNIVSKTTELMIEKGCNPKDIKVFCGPSIQQCCYEVNENVAKQFSDKSVVQFGDKFRVNLTMEIKQQLLNLDILDANIYQSSYCTYESEICHSYRRDGEKSARMIALFGEIG